REPGSVFAYNQPATYTLAAIVQRATGESLVRYLRRRLFDKLGASELSWLQSPPGRDIGYSGLYATTEAVALLGQLYLQGGEWHGEQLLARSWVTEATRAQVPTGIGDASGDGALGYGYQFWMSQHGYRGDGAYGQYCLVLPDEDAVVAMTAQTRSAGRPDMQTVLTMVWDKLLPAFAADTVVDNGADEALRGRLDGLCLPALGGRASPPRDGVGWAGATFLPEGGSCTAQPSLKAVEVRAGEQGWRIALCEDGSELHGPFIGDGWSVTEGASSGGGTVPVACSGAWTGAATLRVDVIFLETPHRLSVTCHLPERTFDARWHSHPAHASFLRNLHAPAPT
ncbi:MAG TPA: serine hydrolase, partial [Acidimicrobiales bacterium]|nr:serine hydrolase [Acidimicrobiales bacterium]